LPHAKILLSEDWISIGKKNLEKRMINEWLATSGAKVFKDLKSRRIL
tara:strand:- start:404 stop:544 length:141 start_codon:yes stop_codon:yes gene_type:complete